MNLVERITSEIKAKNVDGITTDVKNCENKLLVLTNSAAKKHESELFSLPKSTIVFSEKALPIQSFHGEGCKEDFRENFAAISKKFYANASDELDFILVTGTNGKTTTTNFIWQILTKLSTKTCLIGTEGCFFGDFSENFSMTTPDPHVLHRLLFSVKKTGCKAVVMEASAHAIYFKKLFGIFAKVAAITNVTRDHLDFFKTEKSYKAAKAELFSGRYAKNHVKNADFDLALKVRNLSTFSLGEKADLSCKVLRTFPSLTFELTYKGKRKIISNENLVGKFNIENLAAATLSAIKFGVDEEDVFSLLPRLLPPKGRMQKITNDLGLNIFVDFAHTPTALRSVLTSARNFGKTICVFGCGGDRDKGKREIMGEISGKIATLTIITSDNPRTEDPKKIMRDIEVGAKKSGGEYVMIENREEAIAFAIKSAKKGDTILIVGRGAESYMEIGEKKLPCSDEKTIQRILGL